MLLLGTIVIFTISTKQKMTLKRIREYANPESYESIQSSKVEREAEELKVTS